MAKRTKKASAFGNGSGLNRVKILAGPLVTMACVPALANPTGQEVVHGTADFNVDGDVMTITTSDQAIINYESFSIGAGQTVEFIQPTSTSEVLNRVLGDDPSRIDGSLIANGVVYLVNPAGITFGNGALVNVGQLYAAAGNISNEDFLNGVRNFTLTGTVRNEGFINADFVGLLGVRVENTGQIIAKDAIALAAGEEVLIGERGSRVFLNTSGRNLSGDGGVMNAGDLLASGGQVIAGVGDMYGIVLHDASRVEAELISMRAGLLEVSGEMIARTDAPDSFGNEGGTAGGTIELLGDRVALYGATIDASGEVAGGSIRVGGDIQGGGELETSRRVVVDSRTTLDASATGLGHGGTIVVWADEATGFFGSLDVSGGELGGDGGFAEVSARDTLIFDGRADVGSNFGSGGTLLIDPDNITIEDGAGSPSDDPAGSLIDGILNDSDVTGDVTLSENFLESFFGGNLVLIANDSITIDNLSDNALSIPSGFGTTVTFTANANGSGTSNPNGGAFTMNAGDSIVTTGAGVTITGATINLGGIDSMGGAVNLTAIDGLTINGAVLTGGGNFTGSANSDGDITGDFTIGAGGSITSAGGDISINGLEWVIGGAVDAGSGDLSFDIERLGSVDVSIGDGTGSANLDQTELDFLSSSGTFIVGSGSTTPNSVSISDFDTSGSGGTNNLTGDVEITSGGNITVNSGAGESSIFERGLRLTADGAVTFGSDGDVTINNSGSTEALEITTDADGNDPSATSDLLILTSQANIVTNNGDAVISARDIEVPVFSSIDAGTGALTISSDGGTIGLGVDNGENLVLESGELGRLTAGDFLIGVPIGGGTGSSSITVSGNVGATISGDITLNATAANGTITFNNAYDAPNALTLNAAGGVIVNEAVTAMGDVIIDANTDDIANGGSLTVGVNGSIDSNGGDFYITADDLVLDTTADRIIAGAGDVFLTSWNAAAAIGLGSGTGTLVVSDAELTRITSSDLTIGGNGLLLDPNGATIQTVTTINVDGANFGGTTGDLLINAVTGGTGTISFTGASSSSPGEVTLNASNGIDFAGDFNAGDTFTANADFDGNTFGAFTTSGGTVDAGADGIRIVGGDVNLTSGGLSTSGNVAISASDSGTVITVGSATPGFDLDNTDLSNISANNLSIGGGAINPDALAVTQVSSIVVDGVADGSLDNVSGSLFLLALQADGSIDFSGGASTLDPNVQAFADDGITIGANVNLDSAGTFDADFDNSGAGNFVANNTFTLTGSSSVFINANDVVLSGTGTRINAPVVTINNADATDVAQSIALGDATGTLTVDGSELSLITATTLTFGSNAGGIIVDGVDQSTDLANVGNVTLDTMGSLTFNGSDSSFSSLTTNIDDGILIDGVTLTITSTTTLDADDDLDGGVFTIDNGGTLDVTSGDVVILGSDVAWENATGVNITSGSLTVSNSAAGGAIDVGNNPTGGAALHLSNAELALVTGSVLNVGSVGNPTTTIVVDGVTAPSLGGLTTAVNFIATGGTTGTVTFANNASTINSPLTAQADAGVTISTTLNTGSTALFDGDFDGDAGAGHDVNITGALNAGGDVTAIGADFDLTGTIDATGFAVTIAPSTDVTAFVGDGGGAGFRLSSAEMAQITADMLNVGSADIGLRIDEIIVNDLSAGSDANITNVVLTAFDNGGTEGGDVEFVGTSATFGSTLTVNASDRIFVDENLTVADGSRFNADFNDGLAGTGGGNDGGSFDLDATIDASAGGITIVASDYNGTSGGITNASGVTISQSEETSIDVGTANAGDMVIDNAELGAITTTDLTIGGDAADTVATIVVDGVTAGGGLANVSGATTFNANATGGTVSFSNNPSSTPGALNVNADTSITIATGADVSAGGTAEFTSTTINLGDDVTITGAGAANFNGAVSVTADATVMTQGAAGDDVLFTGAVTDTGAFDLVIDAGAAGNAQFDSTATLGSLDVTASTTTLNGATYTADDAGAGGLSFTGDVALGTGVTLNSTGAADADDVSITGAVTGAQDLTVSVSGLGDATFGGTLGTGGTPLSSLDVTANDITFDGVSNISGTTMLTNSGVLDINADMILGGALTQTDAGGSVDLGADITTSDDNVTFGTSVGVDTATAEIDAGTATIALDGGAAAGANTFVLTADEINFGAAVSGTGSLTLRPSTIAGEIDVGTLGDVDDAGVLDISTADLGFLADGFAAINIGTATTGQHVIEIGDATFNDSTNFLAPAGGSISLSGALNNMGGNFTLDGSGATTMFLDGSTVDTMGGNFNVSDNVIVMDDADPTITTGGGAITIDGTVMGTAGGANETLTLDAGSGTINFNDAVSALFDLTIVNGSFVNFTSVMLENNFSTTNALTGDFSASGAFSTGGTTVVNTGTNTTSFNDTLSADGGITITSGDANFGSTVDSSAGGFDLTNSGLADFDGDVTVGGGNIMISGNAETAAGLTFDSGAGYQSFGGTLDLDGTLTLRATSDGGANDGITFGGTVTPGSNGGSFDDLLVLQSASPTTDFQIGDGTTDTSNVLIDNTSLGQLADGFDQIVFGYTFGMHTIEVGTIDVTDATRFLGFPNPGPNAGTVTVTGDVSGTGDASFSFESGFANLNAGSTVTTQGGDISFDNDVVATGGAGGATVTSNGGIITVTGDIFGETGGAGESLTFDSGSAALNITGTITGDSTTADTTGLVDFTINSADGASVTTVDLSGNFNVGMGSALTDNFTATGPVSTGGTTVVDAGTNTVNFDDTLSADGGITITSGDANFGSTVDSSAGGFDLTNSGTADFDGDVTVGGGNIMISGDAVTAAGIIFDSGAGYQNFGGALDLEGTLTLRATSDGGANDGITFNDTVTPGTNATTFDDLLLIQPASPADDFQIGDGTNSTTNVLIDNTSLGQLADGFDQIVFGYTFGMHTIEVGTIDVIDPTRFLGFPTAGPNQGTVTVTGDATGTDNASFSFESGLTNLHAGASVSTQGEFISFADNVVATGGAGGVTVNSDGGAITVGGDIFGETGGAAETLRFEGGTGDVTIMGSITGDGTMKDATGLDAFAIGSGAITMLGTIDLTGAFTLGDTTRISGDLTLGDICVGALNATVTNATFGGIEALDDFGATGAVTIDNSGTLNLHNSISADGAFSQTNTSASLMSEVNFGAGETNPSITADGISFASDVTLAGGPGDTASFNAGTSTISFASLDTNGNDAEFFTNGNLDFLPVVTNSLAGTNESEIFIAPLNATDPIDVGTVAVSQGGLTIPEATFNNVDASIFAINIGDQTNGAHSIQIGDLTVPVTTGFFAPMAPGVILLEGAMFANNTASFSFNAPDIRVAEGQTPSITTMGGDLTFNGPLSGTAGGAFETLTLDLPGGTVTLNGVNGDGAGTGLEVFTIAQANIVNSFGIDISGLFTVGSTSRVNEFNMLDADMDMMAESLSAGTVAMTVVDAIFGQVTTTAGAFTIDNSGLAQFTKNVDILGAFSQNNATADVNSAVELGSNESAFMLEASGIDFDSDVTLAGMLGDTVMFDARLFTATFNAGLNTEAVDTTIAAAQIDFLGGDDTVTTSLVNPATLNLRPQNVGDAIDVGDITGAGGTPGGGLVIDNTDLGAIGAGFTHINYGFTTGAEHAVQVGGVTGSAAFNAPSNFFGDNAGGSVTFLGMVNAEGVGSINAVATNTAVNFDSNAMITTEGGDFTADGDTNLLSDASVTTDGGTIRFLGSIDGGFGLTANALDSMGALDPNDAGRDDFVFVRDAIGGTTALTSLTIDGFDVRLGGIGTSGSEGVSGDTTVTAIDDILFFGGNYNANAQTYSAGDEFRIQQSTTFMSSGDNISFQDSVHDAITSNIELNQEFNPTTDLTINSAGGDIFIDGTISGENDIAATPGEGDVSISALGGMVEITGTAGTVANSLNTLTVTGASVITNGAATQGMQTYNGSLQTAGDYHQLDAMGGGILVNGTLDLNADSTFDTGGDTGDNFIVNGEINGAYALTADAGMGGNVTFFERIGLTTALTGLTLDGLDVRLSGIGQAGTAGVEGDVTVNAIDDIQFARFVYNTNGEQSYTAAGDLRIFEDTTFTSNSNHITLDGSVEGRDGDESLTVDAGTGAFTFGSIGADANDPLTGAPSVVNVSVTADEVDFTGTLQGSGDLFIQPFTASSDIVIGGTTPNGALDLTATEIGGILDGFSSITIGRADGSGDITIAGDVTFNDPTTFSSPSGSSIVDGMLTGIDDASFTFTTGPITINNDIETDGGLVDFQSSVIVGEDSSVTTNGGDVTITGALDAGGDDENFTIDAGAGGVSITDLTGGIDPFGVLSITGFDIAMNGLGTSAAIGADDFSLDASNTATLDALAYNANTLSIDAPFADLIASGDFHFIGDTTINGQVSKGTPGTLTVDGNLFSANVAIITTSSEDFEVTGDTDGPGSLAVIVGDANAMFGGNIGANDSLRALTISSGNLTVTGNTINITTDGTVGNADGQVSITSNSTGMGAPSIITLGDGTAPVSITSDLLTFAGNSAHIDASGLFIDSSLTVSNTIFDDMDAMTDDLVGLSVVLTDDFMVTGNTIINSGLGIDTTGADVASGGLVDDDMDPLTDPVLNRVGDVTFMGTIEGPGGNLLVQLPDLINTSIMDFVDDTNPLPIAINPVVTFMDSIGAGGELGVIALNDTIRLDPATFDSSDTVLPGATVIFGDPAFLDALNNGDESTSPDFVVNAEQFSVNFFEKISVYGNIDFTTDLFRVSDMNILGIMSVNDLANANPLVIELLQRPQALNFAFNPDDGSGLYFAETDIGADINVLGIQGREAPDGMDPGSLIVEEENVLFFGADPVLVDPVFTADTMMSNEASISMDVSLDDPIFFISLPLGRGSIDDSGSAIEDVEVLLPLPAPSADNLRPLRDDLESTLAVVDLDLNGTGIGLNPAIARAVAVASAAELTELPEDNTVTNVQRDALRELEIILRDENPDRVLQIILGYALYDDFAPSGVRDDGTDQFRVTQDRVNYDLVERITELYRGLAKDADNADRSSEVRTRILEATRGYLSEAGVPFPEFDPADFNRFVFSSPEFEDVEQTLLEIRELLDYIRLLGVGPQVQALAESSIVNIFFPSQLINAGLPREIIRLADPDLLDSLATSSPEAPVEEAPEPVIDVEP